jgi:hypothetical protein
VITGFIISIGKQRRQGEMKKSWFSWKWLVFWIVVFFPMAIVYLMIKLGDKNEKKVC